ncbi:ATP-dependent DNA helicase DinG [Domibacillus sp. DTU_2020_1001157_1_SI_ALB_TIR_016]|uniref:ATP-dependent DNA helicase DinG n=1 Tax=Domibacillus sp. DTU_2020_1001157_1_SI_ALB_TIR_016 TaxID=3077789 RepID=UPI0028F14838|nr:ATP-dependent DNA helicase DinG [Domibacillus sp. DTU_2020_1001157_1_SI_ALB_TIR_016]WNS82110.1 ATP-dependent DNA helicase DinG [Domibacillus sp. DTU_2020_1001157_1_SI_ALB_TIR_016]
MINDMRFTVADFETTGHSYASGGRIMQAAFVAVENGRIESQFSTYLNPEMPIPPFIQELTGIEDEAVQQAPFFQEEAERFREWLADSVFVAHNVFFDLPFLNSELEAAGYPPFTGSFIDTVELAKIVLPVSDSYKLGDLSDQFRLSHGQKHRADSDARATAELFIYLVDRLEELPLVTIEQLLKLSTGLKSDIHLLLSRIAAEKKQRVEMLPEEWTVYRGLALRTKKQPEKRKADESISFPQTEEEKWELLAGAPGMQRRHGQMEMMEAVQHFFQNKEHTVIEAGTGTGKSLAYLLPAIYESRRSGRPVVVSTYTVLLQHQLLERELAKLEILLPFHVKAAVLKGKRHYLDLSRFVRSLREKERNYDRIITKMQMLVWLLETETGDGDELNLSSGGALFWKEVCQADDYMNKAKQAWRKHDFARYAKEVAASADIIVTNHSFLIADMKAAKPILVPGSFILIDEAHRFERAARERLGRELSVADLKFFMGKIGTTEERRLLYHLNRIESKRLTERPAEKIMTAVSAVLTEAEEWLGVVSAFFERQTSRINHAKRQLAITEKSRNMAGWQQIEYGAERLYNKVSRLVEVVEEKVLPIEDIRKQLSARDELYVDDALLFLDRCRNWNQQLFELVFRPDEEEVVWIEGDVRSLSNTLTMRTQPVQPGALIQSYLLERHHVLFTSATLTVEQSFQFFAREMGLEAFSYRKHVIPSPFDYANHCRIVIPNDVPDVKETDQDTYAQAVADYIIAAAETAGGRMLVLFTSFDILKKTHDFIRETELLAEYAIFAQGITGGSVTRLAKNFRQYDKSILLGTGALWEGIDIPGEDLSVLFIVRLPFAPPDDPFVEAKNEQLKREGENAFSAYSLPQAVIRFRQGFGRLIRTESDRGVAVLFDRRVLSSRYGKAFLQSIPDVPAKELDITGTMELIEKWLPGEK